MASITFSGQLDQAMNEAAAEGNKILFIPQQTVGEVLPGAASELVVESDGSYSITLAYNTYSIYHYSDVTKKRTLIANSVVVSADTAVSTIPDLIGSTVPVTEDSVLTIQGYLTQAQESATAAATSETNAATSETNAAASEATVTNRVAAYEVESTDYLINTFDGSTLEAGDVVRTLGYYTAGDGGGADWVKTGGSDTASQSPSETLTGSLTDSIGNTFNLSIGSYVEMVKSMGGADAIQSAINYAFDNNVLDIIVNDDYEVTTQLTNRTNVRFIGDGSITGSGAYRVQVFPFNAKCTPSKFSNLDPVKHLAKLRASSSKKVVLVGDSISTELVNQQGWSESQWFRLQKKIENDTGSNITFVNRAIGGNTWADVDSTANSSLSVPDWYDNTETPWLDYVESESPDCVILSFGMNDSEDFDYTNLQSVVSKIKAWDSVPDIVFVTNMVPSIETSIGDYSTIDAQEGRDFVAGYVRNYALRYDYGLIDLNRQCNMVRDGFDVRSSSQVRSVTNQAISDSAYVADTPCRDYWMSNAINGTESEILSYYKNTNPISFTIGRGSSDVVFVRGEGDEGTATISIDFYCGGLIESVDTTVLVPTSNHSLIVSKQDNALTVAYYTNSTGEFTEVYVEKRLMSHGGRFYPRAGYFGVNDSPFSVINFSYGEHELNKPVLTNDEIWGDHTATDASTQMPNGGNGINHPTTKGVKAIYDPVFDNTNFNASDVHSVTYRSEDNKFVGGQLLTDYNGLGGFFIGGLDANNTGLLAQGEYVINVTTTEFKPLVTNTLSCGGAGQRWTTGYFVNSPNVSSDEALKEQRGEISSEELEAGYAIAKLPRFFKWLSEISEKGSESAYLHCSPMAQDVWSAIENAGLDPELYGFISNGDDKSNWSIQPQELLWLVCYAQQVKIDDIEDRLIALES